jgi:hypothetical protein
MQLRASTLPERKAIHRELDDVHAIELEHAKLSASGAHRWMHCTASAWMERHFPDAATEYSAEGTRAHTMASECIEQRITVEQWLDNCHRAIILDAYAVEGTTHETVEALLARFDEDHPVDMQDHVQEYVSYVLDHIEKVEAFGSEFILHGVEQRVNFSRWVPEGFGTADFWCYFIRDGIADVIDYKHGKGVLVHVEDNEQTMLYSLGVWEALQKLGMTPKQFRITVYQPRIGNVRTWMISTEQLLRWADRIVQPVAKVVWASLVDDSLDGVEFDASDPEVCRFCKAKIHCRARADARLDMAKYKKDVAIMTDREVEAVLSEADHLGKWAADLKQWAQSRAAKGLPVKGWKLVAGRANRKYLNDRRVAALLRMEGFTAEQIYEPRKLLGLTKMIALVRGEKKLDKLIGDLIVKPIGKPVLVPEDDPRPAYKPPQDAAGQGFEVEE